MIKRKSILQKIIIAVLALCFVTTGMLGVGFAEGESGSLADNGVREGNDAYDFVIDSQRPSVGGSADMSFGGWSSLGSSLAYMKLPEDIADIAGMEGLWCYCVDITTSTVHGHEYSVTGLDEAEYFDDAAANRIRTILLNSYPHKSIESLEERFNLENLTEEEAFIATQWILWYYSNPGGLVEAGSYYSPANIYKPSEYSGDNITIWYDDENGNEVAARSANVVRLAKALDNLPVEQPHETVPAEIKLEKRVYRDKVIFDYSSSRNVVALENISITVKNSAGEDVPFTHSDDKIVVMLKDIDFNNDEADLTVDVSADQDLGEDVYFFSPRGGRSASQSRAAVYSGEAPVAESAPFELTRKMFDNAGEDAMLKVNKSVLLNGKAHRSENIYYAALFEDEACRFSAFNGDVREIRMGGESQGSVVFDELVAGKTYYVAETDAAGKPLKDGDQGIALIAYDKKKTVAEAEKTAEITITNCYEKDEPGGSEEPGGGGSNTGDSANPMGPAAAMAAALVFAAGMLKSRKRIKDR